MGKLGHHFRHQQAEIKKTNMSFSCLRSCNPNIHSVDHLYDGSTENGSLYSGSGTPPFCNSTTPPPFSGCVVCFEQCIHAVCDYVQKNLVMEGSGKPIALIKGECPTLLGKATNENVDLSGNHAGDPLLPFYIIFSMLGVIAIIAAVWGRKYYLKKKEVTR
ncbi:hypothetical protein PBY51_024151 [Eleginops maclovinus]|uniref:Uncharacterized protein n=1 Tax=Eleginops maclovinus TaxID=56733 RepID=A0AAN7XVY3_ELEMC|nr:hypothetical protein PBY51_024151 [Eleginops maclovinus]